MEFSEDCEAIRCLCVAQKCKLHAFHRVRTNLFLSEIASEVSRLCSFVCKAEISVQCAGTLLLRAGISELTSLFN